MVLAYDAYSETLELEKQKEDKLSAVEKQKFNHMQSMLEKIVLSLGHVQDPPHFRLNGTIAAFFWNTEGRKRVEHTESSRFFCISIISSFI